VKRSVLVERIACDFCRGEGYFYRPGYGDFDCPKCAGKCYVERPVVETHKFQETRA
jgi:hypothetical protein